MTVNDLPWGSLHKGGANFCNGDGSVRFLTDDLDMKIFLAMAWRTATRRSTTSSKHQHGYKSHGRSLPIQGNECSSSQTPNNALSLAARRGASGGRLLRCSLLSLAILILNGCGEASKTVAIQVLSYKGQPLDSGSIDFYPVTGRPVIAVLDSGGKYDAELEPGDYVVTVNAGASYLPTSRKATSRRPSSSYRPSIQLRRTALLEPILARHTTSRLTSN